MTGLPAGVELRTAGPDDRDAVVALLHERMSSRISPRPGAACSTIPGSPTSPIAASSSGSGGSVVGYLAVIYADRRLDGRNVRTANLSSWYLVKPLRGQGVGLAMLQLATRDPDVTYTTFSSNPPALRLMGEVGFVLLDDSRFLWRRSGGPGADIEVLSGFAALAPEVSEGERLMLADHRDLPVEPHLLRAADGDCLVVLSVKKKGADVAYHEVLHLGRLAVFARHAQGFADRILAPGARRAGGRPALPRRLRSGCRDRADRGAALFPVARLGAARRRFPLLRDPAARSQARLSSAPADEHVAGIALEPQFAGELELAQPRGGGEGFQ